MMNRVLKVLLGLVVVACALPAAQEQDARAFCMEIAHKQEATPEQVAKILQYLNSDDQAVVGAAAYALRELGDDSPFVIRALEDKLAARTTEATRSVVGFTLMHLGERGREVLERKARTAVPLRDRISAINALRANLDGLKDPELRALKQEIFAQIQVVYNPDPEPPTGDSAIQDPQMLTGDIAGDWLFFEADGAIGSATYDPSESRVRGGSIRLEKFSAEGEVGLRSVRPLKVRAGSQPMVRFYFRSENAPFNTVLQVYFERPNGSLSVGDINPRGWVVLGNTFLTNQAEGKWMKRFAQAPRSGRDEQYYIRIVLRGNPATVWIDDAAAPAPPYRYIQSAPTQTMTEPRWKEEPQTPAQAQVRKDGDRARLYIDGEPRPPILYTSLRSSFGDYAGMEQLGDVRLLVSSVAISDVVDDRYPPVTPVWTGGLDFDFTTPLQWLEEASLKAQNSNFILNLHFCWPRGWVDAHPDDAWRDAEGKRGYGTAIHFRGFTDNLPGGNEANLPATQVSEFRWWPSPFSERALLDAEEGVRQFVSELKTKPYANRVVGAFISGGHDYQFMTAMWADYSEPAQEAFKQWLRSEYGTEQALRDGWHDQTLTFDNVTIPPPGELLSLVKSEGNIFIDPVKGRRYVDHQRFQAEQGLIIRERLARAFKEAWEEPGIGMTWQMGGGRSQGVETVLLHSDGLDMLVPQPFYELRQPGNVGGVRAALASLSEFGKIVIKELDMRTWLRTSGAEVQAHRLGAAMGPEHFREAFRREAAQMIAAGHGFWFLDLATTHYRDPEILEAISDGVRAYRELEIDNPTPVRPEVAMVWSDDSAYWMADFFSSISRELGGTSVSLLQTIERYTPPYMKQAGVTYDDVYLSDLLSRPGGNAYKVLVFGDAFRLSDREKALIAEQLAGSGRILVWNYAAGYVSDVGLSDAAVGDLVGINVVSEEVNEFPSVSYGDSADPLVSGLDGMAGIGKTGFTLMGGGIPKSGITRGFRRFVVTDEEATALAFYDDGSTAAAVKRFEDYTTVYFGMMGTLDPEVLRRIAYEADAYVISKTMPVAVEFNGRFLSVHGLKRGPVDISLPTVSRVYDFDSGELVAMGQEITIDMDAGQTHWLRVEPVHNDG